MKFLQHLFPGAILRAVVGSGEAGHKLKLSTVNGSITIKDGRRSNIS
ncbi:MAG TPA: hypothetical protein VFZ34_01300 [Blastocatellia bacterium]|nr:hypothetical protein [Blastocatellia bacterium]